MSEKKKEQQSNQDAFNDYLNSIEEETKLPNISDKVANDLNDYSYIREDEKAQRGDIIKKGVIVFLLAFLIISGVFFFAKNNKDVRPSEDYPEEIINISEEEELDDIYDVSQFPIDISNMTLPIEYKNLSLRAFFLESGYVVEEIKEVGSEEVYLPIVDQEGKEVGNITLVSRSGEVVPIENALVTKIDMDFQTVIEGADLDEDMPSFMMTILLDQFFDMEDFCFEEEATTLGTDYVLYMNSKDNDYRYTKLTIHKEMGLYNRVSIEATNSDN